MPAPDEIRWWTPTSTGLRLNVRVTPSAKRSEITDRTGSTLRVRVAAPATDDKANIELKRLLARIFHVRAASVTIERGARARDKVVHLSGISTLPASLLDPA